MNRFVDGRELDVPVTTIDPTVERDQVRLLRTHRERRDASSVAESLSEVERVARGDGNLLYPMKDALRAEATLGEISDALREVFGVYSP